MVLPKKEDVGSHDLNPMHVLCPSFMCGKGGTRRRISVPILTMLDSERASKVSERVRCMAWLLVCYVSANGIQVLITTGVSMVAVLFCFFASNVLSRKRSTSQKPRTRWQGPISFMWQDPSSSCFSASFLSQGCLLKPCSGPCPTHGRQRRLSRTIRYQNHHIRLPEKRRRMSRLTDLQTHEHRHMDLFQTLWPCHPCDRGMPEVLAPRFAVLCSLLYEPSLWVITNYTCPDTRERERLKTTKSRRLSDALVSIFFVYN